MLHEEEELLQQAMLASKVPAEAEDKVRCESQPTFLVDDSQEPVVVADSQEPYVVVDSQEGR